MGDSSPSSSSSASAASYIHMVCECARALFLTNSFLVKLAIDLALVLLI